MRSDGWRVATGLPDITIISRTSYDARSNTRVRALGRFVALRDSFFNFLNFTKLTVNAVYDTRVTWSQEVMRRRKSRVHAPCIVHWLSCLLCRLIQTRVAESVNLYS